MAVGGSRRGASPDVFRRGVRLKKISVTCLRFDEMGVGWYGVIVVVVRLVRLGDSAKSGSPFRVQGLNLVRANRLDSPAFARQARLQNP